MPPLPDTLTELKAFLHRYVILSEEQTTILALWIATTHVIESFDCLAYIAITSATKRAGKTRLLEVLELVVARPWFTGRVTPAVLVRKVNADQPTLLLDETDATFQGDKDYAQALRGILNLGYRRSGKASLCLSHGRDYVTADYDVFGAKAFAGIGDLPATVSDRSIPITMKRKTASESVKQFRAREAAIEAQPIRDALESLATNTDVVDELRNARPDLPDELGDRQQDVTEPLFALADHAGPPWVSRTRQAAVRILSDVTETDDTGIGLLHDVHSVFEDDPFVSSHDLVTRLVAIEDRPWASWRRGQPMNPHNLSRCLKPFGIYPKSNGSNRGYSRNQFTEAWARYPVPEPSKRQTASNDGAETAKPKRQPDGNVDASQTGIPPIDPGLVDTLTV